MGHRCKVADKEQRLLRFLRPPDKNGDVVCLVGAVDPLEALRLVVQLIEGRMARIKLV